MKYLLLSILFITSFGYSQIDDYYYLDTSSYVVVVSSPPEKGAYGEGWYKEDVYFRIPKNFVLKGTDNIIDFLERNNDNTFIMKEQSLSDSSDFIDITDTGIELIENHKHFLKIRIFEFDSLYVKSIPEIQYPFGDSIKLKELPIKLEEVFIKKNSTQFREILEMNMIFINKGISMNQIDFWEYVRDQRYIHREIPCK
ncbi:hypothetical protein [Brumimicrobium mesophilum]|uniref:hypothetical protein n=1 Tax=Brumimicrobium mesophilum TaxID=392717 RepID=UPI000D143477|nr:hypothetical protein [Brumimicrobium mesophilum]